LQQFGEGRFLVGRRHGPQAAAGVDDHHGPRVHVQQVVDGMD
jgi:hypothetical protein